MKSTAKIVAVCALFVLAACTEPGLFSSYSKVVYPVTRVTDSSTKTVQLLNESTEGIQHVLGVHYYSNSNGAGHFTITDVRVNTQSVNKTNIFIPPMGVLEIDIVYAPLNLVTTEAAYFGWVTTPDMKGDLEDFGYVPPFEKKAQMKGAVFFMSDVIVEGDADDDVAEDKKLDEDQGKEENTDKELGLDEEDDFGEDDLTGHRPAIHRAVLEVVYDKPAEGYSHTELVGGAIPGVYGEESANPPGGTARTECVVGGTTACFSGDFSIELPGLMNGAIEVQMTGAIPIEIDGSTAKMDMDQFPPILIVVKGNGPGEPLEGKPVEAISIVISGTVGAEGDGSFDGGNLELSKVGFRIRMDLKEISEEDLSQKLSTMVDFDIEGLDIFTEEPFDGEKMRFGVDTVLSSAPSGNGLIDPFLGGAKVIVRFSGKLTLP